MLLAIHFYVHFVSHVVGPVRKYLALCLLSHLQQLLPEMLL